jgi:hypothetical protein
MSTVVIDIDKEIEMNYGMFSNAGNAVVADLIKMAKNHSLPEKVVMAMMSAIAKDECFGEIEDTEVRECIGSALGWYSSW